MENEENKIEASLLFSKKIRCTVCGQIFEAKMVRTAKLRRLQPDFDLRPRFQNIDTIKYDVYSCPFCGYSALTRNFETLTKGQIALIMDQVCNSFQPSGEAESETLSYPKAVANYKLALQTAEAKRAWASEKAYLCLKLSWMYRAIIEGMPEGEAKQQAGKIQAAYYLKAFEGFQEALTSEDFPICGMDTYTLDYLMACMAYHFKQYGFASKAISNILGSKTADRRVKDKALDLKAMVVEGMKKEQAAEE